MGGVWLLIILLNTGLHAIKMVFPPIAIVYSMRYNSPMIMLATISFFCWAMTWKIKSGFINKVAISVLAVYICSEFFPVYYGPLHWIQDSFPEKTESVLVPLYILLFFAVCIVFDKLRIWVTTPLVTFISNKMEIISRKVIK